MAYAKATTTLILGFFGVIAPSVLLASGIPVIDEISRPAALTIHAAVEGRALAALEPIFDIPLNSEAAAPAPVARITLSPDTVLVGMASFYDGAQETSSGEPYDPAAFTAAAQLDIRDRFGGIRFGKNYQPAYAIGEYDGKKIILKFNDVGPLKPGRKFDLSRAAMAYFDASLEKGLLADFKVTPLPPGQTFATGPVTDEQLVAMGIDDGDDALVTASIANTPTPGEPETEAATQPATEQPPAAEPLVAQNDATNPPAEAAALASDAPYELPELNVASDEAAALPASDSDTARSPTERIALAFNDLDEPGGRNRVSDENAAADSSADSNWQAGRDFGGMTLPGEPDPVWPEETRHLQLARFWFDAHGHDDIAMAGIHRG